MINSALDYNSDSDSLFVELEGLPFFLVFSSFLLVLENRKSPTGFESFLPAEEFFLTNPSISAPSSVLRLFENSISPLTTPVLAYNDI